MLKDGVTGVFRSERGARGVGLDLVPEPVCLSTHTLKGLAGVLRGTDVAIPGFPG